MTKTKRKLTSFCLLGFVILGLNNIAFSQLRNPDKGEIFDISPSSIQTNQVKIRVEKYQIITDSLSRYPEESVTYIFNGKPSDSISEARRSLFTNLDYIESISTSEHGQGGKRLIAVKFRPH